MSSFAANVNVDYDLLSYNELVKLANQRLRRLPSKTRENLVARLRKQDAQLTPTGSICTTEGAGESRAICWLQ